MKISAHLGKISWSLSDKLLYVLYGIVQLYQITLLSADVYGVFMQLVSLNTWIMVVSDGSALQGIIQFGVDPSERRRVNTMALILHLSISFCFSVPIWLLQTPLSQLFNEPRYTIIASALPIYCMLTMPRMFCLRLIYRDIRMRDLFIVDAVWFAVRTAMTVIFAARGTLRSLEDIIIIDFAGMGASSLMALFLTRKELQFGWSGSMTFLQYVRFGVPLALATAMYSTPRQLDVNAIGIFFDSTLAGVYSYAKNLYRFFEVAFDAVTTLLYSAAVRMHSQGRFDDLQTLITKVISATLFPTVVAVLVLELGASRLIAVLGDKFVLAIPHYNVLILGALAMPFLQMTQIIAAFGHSTVVVRFTTIGLLAGMATICIVGITEQAWLVGLGLVVNSVVVGALLTLYTRKLVPFRWSQLLRSLHDFRAIVSKLRSRLS